MTKVARGRLHGRDKADLARVFTAVSERLPDCEVTGEYLPEGWQVRYVTRRAVTPEESWAIMKAAIRH